MRDLRSASTGMLLLAPMGAAGICLGTLGLIESFYVAPFNPSAMWYALGLYGLVGLASGFLWGLLFGGKARRRDFGVIRLTQRAAAVPTFFLSVTAAGFLVYRDAWAESISKAGVGGWLTMLAVPIGALVLSLIAREVGRGLAGKSGKFAVFMFFLSLAGVLLGRGIESTGVNPPELDDNRPEDNRPPVVIIVADALRADALGAYGATEVKTPNMDALAADSVLYEHAYSTSTWTRPAVASLMTGRNVAAHKTMHKSDYLPPELPTMASLISGAGYATVASVTNVNLAPAFGLGRGFGSWGYLAPRPYLGAPISARRLFLVEVYRLIRLRFFPGSRQAASYYAEGEQVSKQGMGFITPLAEAKKPFLAYLHYMETHDPFFAHPYDGHGVARVEDPRPEVSRAKEIRDLYFQEVEHFDGILGDLIDDLKKRGIYERAMIVVTADHGEEFADHGWFWHGTSLYQELVRIPLLIRFPDGAGAGTRRKEPVSLVDLLPTVLSVAGMAPPGDLPGKVLLGQPIMPKVLPSAPVAPDSPDGAAEGLKAGTGDVPDKDSDVDAKPAASPVAHESPSPRTLFAELDHQGCVLSSVLVWPWKLIEANAGNPRGIGALELYHLGRDPLEKTDLSGAQPVLVEELRQVLKSGPTSAAAAPAVKVEQVKVDADTEEQLRALGYTQ